MIEFGPDRLLYIGMGDGGSGNDPENRAQNLNELLGKMLRIDIDRPESSVGALHIASTNPFFGPIAGRDEIYATGLRNPWRFSFDRVTGQLYAGDVGQNIIEEVDIITLGGNYGWRVFEGTRCNTRPLQCRKLHSADSRIRPYSGSSGTLFRNRRLRLSWDAAESSSGLVCLCGLLFGRDLRVERGRASLLLDTSMSISSFGEDEAGEIYVVAMEGSVSRIVNPDAPATPTLYFPDLVTSNESAGEVHRDRSREPGRQRGHPDVYCP